MSESNLPNETPQDSAPESELSFGQYVLNAVKNLWDMFKTAIILAPIFLVLIVVILALLGPSVGNVFSNIVSAL